MKQRKVFLASPYIFWCILFTVIPFLIIVLYSFTEKGPSGNLAFNFTLEHYKLFWKPIYLTLFWRSMVLAVVSTFTCLTVGYPAAYMLSKVEEKKRNLLTLLFVLPLWTNFLLRTYAWLGLLGTNGPINTLLLNMGLISKPLQMLNTNGAIVMGMVYNFLPFMVLPIYSVLVKLDHNLLEAAADLGANRLTTFVKVILPLSFPGIATGIIMVFMPAISTFVISDLLGGAKIMLVGNLIQNQFTSGRNWQFGSAVSVIMMIVIVISMGFFAKKGSKEEGGALW